MATASSSAGSSGSSALRATLIVAHDSRRGIGLNGRLPWKLSKEMKYFANATSTAPAGKQNAVVMGRTTWEGIPPKFRPLKNRINLVLSRRTRDELQLPEGVLQASSLSQAMANLQQQHAESLHRIYIIGGAQLYKSALEDPDHTDRILLTRIVEGDDQWQCDTFFPVLEERQWRRSTPQEHQTWLSGVEVPPDPIQEGSVAWRYEMWTRHPSLL